MMLYHVVYIYCRLSIKETIVWRTEKFFFILLCLKHWSVGRIDLKISVIEKSLKYNQSKFTRIFAPRRWFCPPLSLTQSMQCKVGIVLFVANRSWKLKLLISFFNLTSFCDVVQYGFCSKMIFKRCIRMRKMQKLYLSFAAQFVAVLCNILWKFPMHFRLLIVRGIHFFLSFSLCFCFAPFSHEK